MKYRQYIFSVFLSLFVFETSVSQDIDSLKLVLKASKNNKTKVELYNKISSALCNNNPQEALLYADSALQLSQMIKDKKNSDWAWFNKGKIYQLMGDFKNCKNCFQNTLNFAKSEKDDKKLAQSYGQLGICYRNAEKYKTALTYFQKALNYAEKSEDNNLVAGCCNNMANVLSDLKQYENAAEYLQRIIDMKELIPDSDNLSAAYTNYAEIKSVEGNFEEAKIMLQKAIEIDTRNNNLHALSGGYSNLAGLEYMSGNLDGALRMMEKVIEIDLKIGSPSILAADYNNLGSIYQEFKKYNQAIQYYKISIEYSKKQSGMVDILSSLNGISQCKALTGDMNGAYYTLLESMAIKDTLYNDQTNKTVAEMKSKYETEKKQLVIEQLEDRSKIDSLEIEKVNREKTESDQTKQRQFYIFSSSFFILLLISFLIYRGYRQKQKANEIITKQRDEVEKQKNLVEHQKEIVEEKNKEILDSIIYAKRLQDAILPPLRVVKEYLPESFILYKPKDIVAGDFYFMEPSGSKIVIAAADCTGHGVPGAMVSVVCANALNRTVKEFKLIDSGKILDKVRELVLETFAKSESEVKDGMDISLCVLDLEKKKIYWSGANNPLWLVRKNNSGNNELFEFKPDKQPIGKTEKPEPFRTEEIKFNDEDVIYIFTDGFEDQFGGEKGKKFKSSKMKEMVLSVQNLSMENQRNIILNKFEDWKGDLEQVDDVCIIGVKL
jgi:tetratricopeptide (TPR) repeat protein